MVLAVLLLEISLARKMSCGTAREPWYHSLMTGLEMYGKPWRRF